RSAFQFDPPPPAVPSHPNINPFFPSPPLRSDSITVAGKILRDVTLEWRLRFLLVCFLERAHEMGGIVRVLDQLPAQVFGFQILLRVDGMNNPHLVPAAARSHVEALFEELLVP